MSGLSVLTLVRNRQAHLDQLAEGLRRSLSAPLELVIVDMSDRPVTAPALDIPVRVERIEGASLPLAAARNRAARTARGERLLFLDVDCIPSAALCGLIDQALLAHDAAVCPEVLYLPAGQARGPWDEARLRQVGAPHPVRPFPASGMAPEGNPGLFWSLAFGLRRPTFQRLGGFDEAFVGYGAEDTDLGFRIARAGLPLMFMGGAPAFHQHHDGYDPPLQHFDALIANARLFHAKWGVWPMDGWLRRMAQGGLVEWTGDDLRPLRRPSAAEIAAARKPAGDPF